MLSVKSVPVISYSLKVLARGIGKRTGMFRELIQQSSKWKSD